MNSLLFIGHSAGRSGAPFVLLYLLRWIHERHPECDVDLILLTGGSLEAEYRAVANVHVVPPRDPAGTLTKKYRSLRSRFDAEFKLGLARIPHFDRKYDLVVGNTAVTLRHLELFKRRGFKTVSWLHELTGAIEVLGLTADFAGLAEIVDHIIVGSDAVGAMVRRFGVTTPVDRIYEFSPRGSDIKVDIGAIRRELGVPESCFLVGACGTIESRKGADLFVETAAVLSGRDDIRSVWVARADAGSDPMFDEMRAAIESHGLTDRLMIVRSDDDPVRILSAIDLFVLPSREDPFPLVCLEAANVGKPIVCFADAGGMPEFVGDDAGEVVPFGDVSAMANAIERFCGDPELAARSGAAAKLKAQTDFSMETSCSAMFDVLSGV